MTWQTIAAPLIQQFEGCELTAYHGAADRPGLYTIGWGATGPGIVAGVTWTQDQADARFAVDLEGFGAGVANMVAIPINDNEKAALVSFAYNLGLASLKNSTLLRMLNEGNISGASAQFLNWDHANGIVVPGLQHRRTAERAIFDAPQT